MMLQRHAYMFLIVVATASALVASQSQADIASSDFAADSDGWALSGDPATPAPTYIATGGNPGGYIRGTDAVLNNTWYFDAPAKFLGNASASYGFTLTFDQRANGFGNAPFDWDDVVLTSPGLSLFYDITAPMPQIGAWTGYSVPLSEGPGWSLGSLGAGGVPTQVQFIQVLSNLTSLRIRGEFFSGIDTGDLDNVVLNGAVVPEASLAPLFALVVAGLASYRFLGHGVLHRRQRRS
jgi:hypothetical protein